MLTETWRTILHPCIIPNPNGTGCSGQEGIEQLPFPPLSWLGKLFQLGYLFQFLTQFFLEPKSDLLGEWSQGWMERQRGKYNCLAGSQLWSESDLQDPTPSKLVDFLSLFSVKSKQWDSQERHSNWTPGFPLFTSPPSSCKGAVG